MDWSKKSVLLIGGTGSFGSNFIKYLLEHNRPKVIRVFSRDEHKQTQMLGEYGGVKGGPNDFPVRGFIGDIRDLERLRMAMEGIDIVVHAAALKQVQSCEYNPLETIKTNVMGAANVIQAALDNNVEKVLGISTDKAVAPLNLYGASKLCMERLFEQANSYRGSKRTKFACTRYGNVADSRGTVVHIWRDRLIQNKPLQVTNPQATRYWITMKEANQFVMEAIELMDQFPGGEVFTPVIPSVGIMELKRAMAPMADFEVIGDRVGDKLHEAMILAEETVFTVTDGKKNVVLPKDPSWTYEIPSGWHKLPNHEALTSGNNKWFLNADEIASTLETR